MEYIDIFDRYKDQHVLVIGDVMIDAYIWGVNERMSPEAPVPVVDVHRREARLGGAANVALNLQAAGAQATILSVVGDRGRQEEYMHLMQAAGMSTAGLITSDTRRTTVKTRVISDNQHMLRVDEEDKHLLDDQEEQHIIDRLESLLKTESINAVILQDYNKGVLSPKVIRSTIDRCNALGIKTMVDPKKDHFMTYYGCSLFKPNLKEMREGLGLSEILATRASLSAAVESLRQQMQHSATLITLSQHGVYWNEEGQDEIIPVFDREIIDVSGAGDSVIAIATLSLAAGATLAQAAWLADMAGGMVCEHVGVQPIDREAMRAEILSHQLK